MCNKKCLFYKKYALVVHENCTAYTDPKTVLLLIDLYWLLLNIYAKETESEFNEFEPRLKFAKNRVQLNRRLKF